MTFARCLSIAITVCSNTTYKVINDPRRSKGSVWEQGERALCDRGLQWGWYRFTSFAGGKMPEGKVDLKPLWYSFSNMVKRNSSNEKMGKCGSPSVRQRL
ncbi:hypothetical protein OS493_028118 [Desmophyllum pertusum]|uniref:Uncharacterized protein n=1 Tax=Desmophyllum pertusum TaxID=174260 RepID=A0A9X0D187_9CNID|nr:hypothetical protein OS493_028118 [Desmophyllum pertusum]